MECRVSDLLLICSLVDQSFFFFFKGASPPQIPPCIHTSDINRSRVREDSCAQHVARCTVLLALQRVLVPIVLVMVQTGPPTSRHIIPCWYAMHVTKAVKQLAHQMCQIYAQVYRLNPDRVIH